MANEQRIYHRNQVGWFVEAPGYLEGPLESREEAPLDLQAQYIFSYNIRYPYKSVEEIILYCYYASKFSINLNL